MSTGEFCGLTERGLLGILAVEGPLNPEMTHWDAGRAPPGGMRRRCSATLHSSAEDYVRAASPPGVTRSPRAVTVQLSTTNPAISAIRAGKGVTAGVHANGLLQTRWRQAAFFGGRALTFALP